MSMELNCTTQQRCIILAFEFVFSVTLILVLNCVSNVSEKTYAHDHDTHNVMHKSNRVSNLNKLKIKARNIASKQKTGFQKIHN